MKTLILYTSKTGSTKQYVDWLSEDISGCVINEIQEISETNFELYDRIIFALPTRGGQIDSKELIEQFWDNIVEKDVYLIAVGMVPEDQPWSRTSYNAIAEKVRDGIKGYVKLPGISPNAGKEMSWLEKFFLKVFLKADPDSFRKQNKVQRKDLYPALKMIKEDYY
jgi:menaquinone-dependent protoporphyrinogen IX oxidase